MRRMRFFALGIVSFVVAIVGTLLAPGTFVNRAFSAALCTLFSFNWTFCTVDLGGNSQRVVAANPPAVVADISDYLQAQRDPSEFGDEPSAPSPQQSNPQAPPFPQDPGPNFPVRREFDEPNPNSSAQPSFVTVESGKRYQLNGTSSDKNSRYTAEIMIENGEAFLKSIVLAVKSSSNLPDEIYNIEIAPSGTEMSIISNHRGTLTIKRMQNSWVSQFINPSGISTNWEIPVKPKFNKNFIKMINKRLCQDQAEEVISRNIPNLLDFINEMADRFKKLFAFGLELDNNLRDKPEQKEKLFEEFEEKIDELKDFNDKLKESIECEPSETTANQQPTRQTAPVVTSFGCNGGITCTVRWGSSATLRFTYEDKDGNANNWEITGFTRGEPVAKGTISPPNGSGTINHAIKCEGSGSRDFPVSVTVTDTTGLKSSPLSVTVMCR